MAAPLIGITGYARSGKDTFAARLTEAHGFAKASFAQPVKDAALRLDPLIPFGASHPQSTARLSWLVGRDGWEYAKDFYPEVRRTLQRLGTDAIRTLDPDFWVRMAVGKLDPAQPTVFTDVRFPNEADAILASGGHLVRVTRPDQQLTKDRHPSETAMDNYEVQWTILNQGTVADLHGMADNFMSRLQRYL